MVMSKKHKFEHIWGWGVTKWYGPSCTSVNMSKGREGSCMVGLG